MSDSARHNLYYLIESVFGTTPAASPAFVDLRHTGTTLGTSKGSNVSEELHENRQIKDFRHGTKTVAGDVNFELSYTSFEDFLEATLLGTWATNILKAGITRRSFSVLRHFTDIVGADKPYHLYSGCEINTLNLSIAADSIVTGTFGLMGKSPSLLADLTSLGIPTFGDPTTTEPFDAFTGSISEGGSGIATITELTLSLTNNLERRTVVGADTTLQHAIGRSNVTGSINVYFEDSALMEKFLAETVSTLAVTLTDPAGNSYLIELPRIKYTGGQPDVSGEGAVQINLPFQAIYDPTEDTNIKITRIPAA